LFFYTNEKHIVVFITSSVGASSKHSLVLKHILGSLRYIEQRPIFLNANASLVKLSSLQERTEAF